MRRVFYSFHYQQDAWRASMVRNIQTIEGSPAASDNEWETIKRGGDAAIRRWIDGQMHGRSCTIVLVGTHTADRPWVRYEIEKSMQEGKGLFGIRIHRLLNQHRLASAPGRNPFENIVLANWQSLAAYCPLYNPPGLSSSDVYAHIRQNLEGWIERAVGGR